MAKLQAEDTRDLEIAVRSDKYNPEGRLQRFTVNQSKRAKSWRLVHDGTEVVSLVESDGLTETRATLVCFDTRAEAVAECLRLGLTPPEQKV